MNIALWIVQILLACLFLVVGAAKAFSATEAMAQAMSLSTALVRFIGVCEILGALGLILPAASRIMPKLTVWAAIGLGTVMVLATAFHISRAEYPNAAGPIALLAGTAFVAYGRSAKRPIVARRAQTA